MLSNIHLNLNYRTGESDLVEAFYKPCLKNAVFYDRAAGFFKSTVFLLVMESVVNFAISGGKIRLVCSPELDENDIEAITKGYNKRQEIIGLLLKDEIDELLENIKTKEHTIALATFVSLGILDIKIAIRPISHGLYHEKLGIFKDAYDNIVTFRGSSNETLSAWHNFGNYESFDVFCSWMGNTDKDRISDHTKYFERLWEGDIDEVETILFPQLAFNRLKRVAKDSLDELQITSVRTTTKRKKPFKHQVDAIKSWKERGRRGIIEHATGSGKTFTAIEIIKDHIGSDGSCIVLVPSELLLKQWEKELNDEISDLNILTAGAGNTKWKLKNRLESFSSPVPKLGKRLVLSTLQTAAQQLFINRINDGEHLLLVCDEVHTSGSNSYSNIFKIDAGSRLGLSATPKRYGDELGTNMILNYFGGVIDPPFTLSDAIKAGRLVPYKYFPYPISLTIIESEEWDRLTGKIKIEYARFKNSNEIIAKQIPSKLELLIYKRSRIIKKASAKVDFALEVLQREYQHGSHWLAYCEDEEQLSQLTLKLREQGLPVCEYYSNMEGSKTETLKWFNNYGGIVVSIRCLDEGVDIPEASHALILASSQNPRQFIQRRGRVLRKPAKSSLKSFATIFDVIVIPSDWKSEHDQTSITKTEIKRAISFAKDALNPKAEIDLLRIVDSAGIDISEIEDFGIELDGENYV